MQTKADLHVHVDADFSKKAIVQILEEAEAEGVKAVSLLHHNSLNVYLPGGGLYEIIHNEGIKQYFSGKVIAGVEQDCKLQGLPLSPDGFDFNGYMVHILAYGFNPLKLAKEDVFNPDVIRKNWNNDLLKLIDKGRILGLQLPPKEYFSFDKPDRNAIKQLWAYIVDNKDKCPNYARLTEQYPHGSAFFKGVFNDPKGVLFYDASEFASLNEFITASKKHGAKISIAHPYYMQAAFNPLHYLDAVIGTEKVLIDAIEVPYALNSKEQNTVLELYAAKNKLAKTGGSDYQRIITPQNPNGQMFCMKNGEKIMYDPKPGFAIRENLDNNQPNIKIDDKILKQMPDVREFITKEQIKEKSR